ncbi:hypothetical protein GCM10023065_08310 [Microbacterium laevaniformans]|uniref:hypothetical protein n=1 Tax=Microbacterium laevaniformans TaxID=36807 RepID=UPI0019593FE3|nr:hypothetical protein [Microbacterium laevaniformans]MBM7751783.1 uncharacterized protein with LGFP repeats [Microbacterium laevaniformans]GLJ63863.1 hypothetical protein GCM10017578_07510 [Microbacterium laevaniformans]
MSKSRRIITRVVCALAAVAAVLAVVAAQEAPPAQAANASDFRAGLIISDHNFFDAQSMNADQVQDFLNGKVPRCSGSNGQPCLKDYSTNVTPIAADSYCSGIPAGTMTAAQIIVAAARACGISPKVLIVMLQKEQGLITDRSPDDWSYRAALGQGCPDTAPCDNAFSGFYRQVYFGARQLRIYQQRPEWFGYQIGWNNILRSPDTSCGTARVYIENDATRALYIYTPYTPNAASLGNLYGSGDDCSTYGNRNFWRDYSDWFGSPLGSIGEQTVTAKYNSLGGASSWLGTAATSIVCGIKDGGCWQLFANGLIVYSPATGAQEMQARVHDAWVSQGYENGWMGYPATPTVCGIKNGGCWQLFQGGVIMYSPATGTQPMRAVIHDAWVSQGYENGWMGFPTTPTNCVSRDGGCWQLFESGLILYSPATGAQPMRSVIHQAWVSEGYENGWLGYPTAGSEATSNGGYTQTFQGGAIAVDQNGTATYSGTAANTGAAQIANAMRSLSWLGAPATPAVCGSKDGGCWRAFDNGVIMYSPAAGTHALRPAIHRAWVSQGYEQGWLGYPTSDASAAGSGFTQKFQGGTITVDGAGTATFTANGSDPAHVAQGAIATRSAANNWLGTAGTPVVCGSRDGGCWQAFTHGVVIYSPATGAQEMRSEVQSGWVAQGYENGWMGYPTGPSVCGGKDGGCWQSFQSGVVMYSPRAGANAVRPAFHDAWVGQGYEDGWMGYPTTPTVCGGRDDGCWQAFEGGVILSSPSTGTHVMRPQIQTAWVAQGYEVGRLGYPTSDSKSTPDGGYTQDFQGGTVTVAKNGDVTLALN